MATKIKLGARPKNFKREIKFQMLDGSTGCMEVTYAYRTRAEFAEFADSMQAKIKAQEEAEITRIKEAAEKGETVPDFKQSDMIERQSAFNVDYIMQAVEGWNLDVAFDKDAVAELVDTLPAAVAAIVTTYRDAITEGRLGN